MKMVLWVLSKRFRKRYGDGFAVDPKKGCIPQRVGMERLDYRYSILAETGSIADKLDPALRAVESS